MEIKLNPEEHIDFVIKKKRYFPFKIEDLLKLVILTMFSFFISLIFNDIKRFNKEFSISELIPLLMMFFSFIIVSINFYKRYLIAYKWKYIVTNQRLIIKNHKNLIANSFYFNDFPALSFEENAYSNGYLIIGEKEPVFTESKLLTNYTVGINLSENDIVLYNIVNVKEIYSILNSKIASYSNS